MIGSDGEIPIFGRANPHPRSYGTNARVLGRYVRDLKVVTLEDNTACTIAANVNVVNLAIGKEVTLPYTAAANGNTCSAVTVATAPARRAVVDTAPAMTVTRDPSAAAPRASTRTAPRSPSATAATP